jgi:hypothetical protein
MTQVTIWWKGQRPILVGIFVLLVIDISIRSVVVDFNSMSSSMASIEAGAVENRNRPSFTEILVASGSDKYTRHHYERYYERWLEPLRDVRKLQLLEIGANQGHSLKLWSDYFTHAQSIVGLAYGEAAKNVDQQVDGLPGGVKVVWGDQSTLATMNKLQKLGPWNVIIDDGSHVPQHMMYSLFHLWKAVKPGGLYVIEDLETNYWKDGMGVYSYKLSGTGIHADANHSAVTKLQQFIHVLQRFPLNQAKQMSVMPGDDQLCSMEWGMNLVLLRKCGLPTDGSGPPSDMDAPWVDGNELAAWVRQAKASNPLLK